MLKPGDIYYGEFTTASPTTGAAVNADSLPVATANHNGTDDGAFTLTVTNIDTGRYKVVGTVPSSGYVGGDSVNITVAATVGGIAGKARVDRFEVDTKRSSDLDAKLGTPAGASIAADIASGGGLFQPGTISTVVGAGSFVVAFAGTTPTAAGLVGLYCCIASTANSPAKGLITGASAVDATHVSLTFAVPFTVLPAVNNAVQIG